MADKICTCGTGDNVLHSCPTRGRYNKDGKLVGGVTDVSGPQSGAKEVLLRQIARDHGLEPAGVYWRGMLAAFAAGRARGIEEERKRCEGIARARGKGPITASISNEIADAIAKETP